MLPISNSNYSNVSQAINGKPATLINKTKGIFRPTAITSPLILNNFSHFYHHPYTIEYQHIQVFALLMTVQRYEFPS